MPELDVERLRRHVEECRMRMRRGHAPTTEDLLHGLDLMVQLAERLYGRTREPRAWEPKRTTTIDPTEPGGETR